MDFEFTEVQRAFQAEVETFLDAGLDGMIFNMPHVEDPDAIELAGQTLAGLGQSAAVR